MIAIISDVHGNYPALRAVLEEIDKRGCNEIISLGDVSGYYCMVNECINEFRERGIINILGNHDFYVLGRGECPRSYTVNRITEYQKKIITKENMEYLNASLPGIDNKLFLARHGGWRDPIDEYIVTFNFDDVKDNSINIFCSGHTHVQKLVENEDKSYFNPGSVGQPRDEDPRAAYAIIDDENKVHLYRVKYDIDEIAKKMNAEGFEERTYSCLYVGTKIGGNK